MSFQFDSQKKESQTSQCFGRTRQILCSITTKVWQLILQSSTVFMRQLWPIRSSDNPGLKRSRLCALLGIGLGGWLAVCLQCRADVIYLEDEKEDASNLLHQCNRKLLNPVLTRLCRVIFYKGDEKYPSLGGIELRIPFPFPIIKCLAPKNEDTSCSLISTSRMTPS